MAAYPISIPGASSRVDVMSPSSMASPLSISSPYSVHSSLSNNSITGQTLASSFATSVNSNSSAFASALSPPSEDEIETTTGSTASSKKHKPHECDVCGACFARKVHLQRHSLRHQVCKPYCCERCGKCFSRQDSLVRHHRLLHEKIKEKPKRAGGSTKKKTVKESNQISHDSSSYSKTPSTASTSSLHHRNERRQSVGQMTINSNASSFEEEDEDMMSISEETSAFASTPFPNYSSFDVGHGQRRNTVSNMESLSHHSEFQCSFPRVFDDTLNPATSHWAAQLHQPHPFEMPHVESMNFMDVKSLHPQQLHQHISAPSIPSVYFDAATAATTSSPVAAMDDDIPLLSLFQQASHETSIPAPAFDWSSLIHGAMDTSTEGRQTALPFSKSASDKSLNATLSRGPDGQDTSCFPSPSIHALQKLFPTAEQQQAVTAMPSTPSLLSPTGQQQQQINNGTINLAALGLPVPPNLNISLPADLQMSAENWDNLMRCLTLMANRQAQSQTDSLKV